MCSERANYFLLESCLMKREVFLCHSDLAGNVYVYVRAW